MHYYKRNLGEYAKKAGRLSMVQHGAYNLLMDCCYDREKFPTAEEAIDWAWASSKEEIEAVEFVLKKFFILEGGVYTQKRIKEEILAYQEMSKINKQIALDRETKRVKKTTGRKKNKTERLPSVDGIKENSNESPPNQEPRTKNQEPRTNINRSAIFVELWKTFKKELGEKGSKKKALVQFAKIPDETAGLLKCIVEKQISAKIRRRDSGEFTPNFPHVVRWLRDERWNDEIIDTPQTKEFYG